MFLFLICFRLLSDIVMHFPVSQEEITLFISPTRVILKNYFEEDSGQEFIFSDFYK